MTKTEQKLSIDKETIFISYSSSSEEENKLITKNITDDHLVGEFKLKQTKQGS